MSSELTASHASRRPPYEDLRVTVGRMDGKLDSVLSMIPAHETRIQKLEAWVNRWIGWTVATSLAGGGASAAALKFLIG